MGLFFLSANIVALTANLLTGAGVLISNPRAFGARVFAGVMLSSACYLLGRTSYAVPAEVQTNFWFWPFLLVLMNVGMGLWMMLSYSLFQDERRIPRWMIAAFGVQASLSTINAFAYTGRDSSLLQSEAFPPLVNFLFGPLPIALQSTFALLALWWAVRGWRADLDDSRRVLRGLFFVLFGGVAFGASVTELVLVDAVYATRAPFDNAITLVMAAAYLSLALAVLRFDGRVLERFVARATALPDPRRDPGFDRDHARLIRALDEERVYRTHGLSIAGLAGQLEIPEYRLRALINKRLGYRNFNALLHEYRLREACAQLADPARASLPILTIALDVGYQSIAPFNQAFREAVGCTPSAYRRRQAAPKDPAA